MTCDSVLSKFLTKPMTNTIFLGKSLHVDCCATTSTCSIVGSLSAPASTMEELIDTIEKTFSEDTLVTVVVFPGDYGTMEKTYLIPKNVVFFSGESNANTTIHGNIVLQSFSTGMQVKQMTFSQTVTLSEQTWEAPLGFENVTFRGAQTQDKTKTQTIQYKTCTFEKPYQMKTFSEGSMDLSFLDCKLNQVHWTLFDRSSIKARFQDCSVISIDSEEPYYFSVRGNNQSNAHIVKHNVTHVSNQKRLVQMSQQSSLTGSMDKTIYEDGGMDFETRDESRASYRTMSCDYKKHASAPKAQDYNTFMSKQKSQVQVVHKNQTTDVDVAPTHSCCVRNAQDESVLDIKLQNCLKTVTGGGRLYKNNFSSNATVMEDANSNQLSLEDSAGFLDHHGKDSSTYDLAVANTDINTPVGSLTMFGKDKSTVRLQYTNTKFTIGSIQQEFINESRLDESANATQYGCDAKLGYHGNLVTRHKANIIKKWSSCTFNFTNQPGKSLIKKSVHDESNVEYFVDNTRTHVKLQSVQKVSEPPSALEYDIQQSGKYSENRNAVRFNLESDAQSGGMMKVSVADGATFAKNENSCGFQCNLQNENATWYSQDVKGSASHNLNSNTLKLQGGSCAFESKGDGNGTVDNFFRNLDISYDSNNVSSVMIDEHMKGNSSLKEICNGNLFKPTRKCVSFNYEDNATRKYELSNVISKSPAPSSVKTTGNAKIEGRRTNTSWEGVIERSGNISVNCTNSIYTGKQVFKGDGKGIFSINGTNIDGPLSIDNIRLFQSRYSKHSSVDEPCITTRNTPLQCTVAKMQNNGTTPIVKATSSVPLGTQIEIQLSEMENDTDEPLLELTHENDGTSNVSVGTSAIKCKNFLRSDVRSRATCVFSSSLFSNSPEAPTVDAERLVQFSDKLQQL